MVFLRICNFLSSVIFQALGVRKRLDVTLDRCYTILNNVRWIYTLVSFHFQITGITCVLVIHCLS